MLPDVYRMSRIRGRSMRTVTGTKRPLRSAQFRRERRGHRQPSGRRLLPRGCAHKQLPCLHECGGHMAGSRCPTSASDCAGRCYRDGLMVGDLHIAHDFGSALSIGQIEAPAHCLLATVPCIQIGNAHRRYLRPLEICGDGSSFSGPNPPVRWRLYIVSMFHHQTKRRVRIE